MCPATYPYREKEATNMWSLPDIVAMNNASHENANRLERASRTLKLNRKRLKCDYCDEPAITADLYYDIFSSDPKGLVARCQEHDDDYGSIPEGYFYCDACNRLMVENYTWELYHACTDSGQFCINCYRENELLNPDNWISLTDIDIAGVSFKRVRHAKHLIAVGQDTPKGLKFLGNVEFDSISGGRIRGFSSADDTPEAGLQEIRDLLAQASEDGYKRAILILDAGYQFAVSIGVYVPAEGVD
jgi:hypothetical protein